MTEQIGPPTNQFGAPHHGNFYGPLPLLPYGGNMYGAPAKDATLVWPNTEKYLEIPVFGSFRVYLVQFDFGK